MIEWTEGAFSSHYGHVGKIRLFGVHWSSTRHSDGRMYVLTTDLPGFSRKVDGLRFRTVAEAKAAAEPIMAEFLSYLEKHWKDKKS